MRWRTTPFGALLVEQFITTGFVAGCQHGNVFADDIQRAYVVLLIYDEGFV
jgi:hypothetical protein